MQQHEQYDHEGVAVYGLEYATQVPYYGMTPPPPPMAAQQFHHTQPITYHMMQMHVPMGMHPHYVNSPALMDGTYDPHQPPPRPSPPQPQPQPPPQQQQHQQQQHQQQEQQQQHPRQHSQQRQQHEELAHRGLVVQEAMRLQHQHYAYQQHQHDQFSPYLEQIEMQRQAMQQLASSSPPPPFELSPSPAPPPAFGSAPGQVLARALSLPELQLQAAQAQAAQEQLLLLLMQEHEAQSSLAPHELAYLTLQHSYRARNKYVESLLDVQLGAATLLESALQETADGDWVRSQVLARLGECSELGAEDGSSQELVNWLLGLWGPAVAALATDRLASKLVWELARASGLEAQFRLVDMLDLSLPVLICHDVGGRTLKQVAAQLADTPLAALLERCVACAPSTELLGNERSLALVTELCAVLQEREDAAAAAAAAAAAEHESRTCAAGKSQGVLARLLLDRMFFLDGHGALLWHACHNRESLGVVVAALQLEQARRGDAAAAALATRILDALHGAAAERTLALHSLGSSLLVALLQRLKAPEPHFAAARLLRVVRHGAAVPNLARHACGRAVLQALAEAAPALAKNIADELFDGFDQAPLQVTPPNEAIVLLHDAFSAELLLRLLDLPGAAPDAHKRVAVLDTLVTTLSEENTCRDAWLTRLGRAVPTPSSPKDKAARAER
jgi:hypothetical protein